MPNVLTPPAPDHKLFPVYLREQADQRGVSLHALALAGRISPNTISLWYHGSVRPQYETLRKFAVHAGLNFSEVLRAAGAKIVVGEDGPDVYIDEAFDVVVRGIHETERMTAAQMEELRAQLERLRLAVQQRKVRPGDPGQN